MRRGVGCDCGLCGVLLVLSHHLRLVRNASARIFLSLRILCVLPPGSLLPRPSDLAPPGFFPADSNQSISSLSIPNVFPASPPRIHPISFARDLLSRLHCAHMKPMASPAPLAPASPAANPPLSYAERAKKAQNAKPSPQQASQRSAAQGTSLVTLAPSSSSTARPAAASKAPPPVSLAAEARPTTAAPPSSSSKAAVVSPSDNTFEPKLNGDVKHAHGSDSGSSAPASGQAQKQPPTNVWDARRKEQMARASTQTRPPQTAPPSTDQSESLHPSPPQSGQDVTADPGLTIPGATSPAQTQTSSAPGINGRSASTTDYDDLFVVKPGRFPSGLGREPPGIDDAESWPEVGQAAAIPSETAKSKESRDDDERRHEREPSQGHGSRKGTLFLTNMMSVQSFVPCLVYAFFHHLFLLSTHELMVRIALLRRATQVRRPNGSRYLQRIFISRTLRGLNMCANVHKPLNDPILVILPVLREQARLRLVRGLSSKAGRTLRVVDDLHRPIQVPCPILKRRVGQGVFSLVLDIQAFVGAGDGYQTMLVGQLLARTKPCNRRNATLRRRTRSLNRFLSRSLFPVGTTLLTVLTTAMRRCCRSYPTQIVSTPTPLIIYHPYLLSACRHIIHHAHPALLPIPLILCLPCCTRGSQVYLPRRCLGTGPLHTPCIHHMAFRTPRPTHTGLRPARRALR